MATLKGAIKAAMFDTMVDVKAIEKFTSDQAADKYVAEEMTEHFAELMPEGITFEIKVGDGAGKKLAAQIDFERLSPLQRMPKEMVEYFEDRMVAEFEVLGAKITEFNYNVRYAPKLKWEYEGEEYYGEFYLNGTPDSIMGRDVRDAHLHNLTSVICAMAPKLKRRQDSE